MDFKNRIIARGEHSNHCHVITGNVIITREGDDIFINPEDSSAVIKHLLEDKWLKGIEVWTQEHQDIKLDLTTTIRHGDVVLKPDGNRYKYIQSIEYDPFDDIIREVTD